MTLRPGLVIMLPRVQTYDGPRHGFTIRVMSVLIIRMMSLDLALQQVNAGYLMDKDVLPLFCLDDVQTRYFSLFLVQLDGQKRKCWRMEYGRSVSVSSLGPLAMFWVNS